MSEDQKEVEQAFNPEMGKILPTVVEGLPIRFRPIISGNLLAVAFTKRLDPFDHYTAAGDLLTYSACDARTLIAQGEQIGLLEVVFRSNPRKGYYYQNVPARLVAALALATSPGSFLNGAIIKNKDFASGKFDI